LLRARVDREIDAIARGEVGDLLRGSLMQVELDLRVALAELANDRGEHVARLGVCRADRQRAAAIAALLFGQPLDALNLPEDAQRALDDALTCRSDSSQRAALAQKDRKAELVFELFELFAHARLGRMEALGRRGDVQVVLDDRCEIS